MYLKLLGKHADDLSTSSIHFESRIPPTEQSDRKSYTSILQTAKVKKAKKTRKATHHKKRKTTSRKRKAHKHKGRKTAKKAAPRRRAKKRKSAASATMRVEEMSQE